MRLENTTPDQDKILSECEDFGGKAAEAVEVSQSLDAQIQDLREEIEGLKNEIKSLKRA